MNNISAEQVKKLREQTGAGMMDAKKALEQAGGDFDEGVKILRQKGQALAAKKSARTTKQGIIDSYIHGEGRIGVMVEVNVETDFVARNQDFRSFVHDLTLHIAAQAPLYVSREDVPKEIVDKERDIFASSSAVEGKPGDVADKIVLGKMEKYFSEVCLLEQPFVRDQDITISDLINQKIAKLGENIQIRRFVRYMLGE